MGIAQDIIDDWDAALAALQWQLEAGVDVAFGDLPVNRYEAAPPPEIPLPQAAPLSAPQKPEVAPAAPIAPKVDPVGEARNAAAKAQNLDELNAALEAFEHCSLKRGAKNTIFGQGNPAARVMVIGEATTREEDHEGVPFAAEAGLLLGRMFAAIGLSLESPDPLKAIYLAAPLPWRPLGSLAPEIKEMMKPFLLRHISLADPDFIVVMGNTGFEMLGGKGSVSRMRGQWFDVAGKPALAMLHPASHLARPITKREAWADLQALKGRLDDR